MAAANLAPSGDEVIIFIHLAKNAGTTLGDIFSGQYRKDQICRFVAGYGNVPFLEGPEHNHGYDTVAVRDRDACIDYVKRLPDNIKVIFGHPPLFVGCHEFLSRRSTYVTIIREPVDRMMSTYYFRLTQYPYQSEEQRALFAETTLDEFVSSGRFVQDNNQTRRLAGPLGHEVKFGHCGRELLETAKSNLRERFAVVGTTERFDDTLLLLKRRFGWNHVQYTKQNVTERRMARESLSDDTLQVIQAHNELDLELHKFAGELLDEAIARHGVDFKAELEAFRRVNVSAEAGGGRRSEVTTLSDGGTERPLFAKLTSAYADVLRSDSEIERLQAREAELGAELQALRSALEEEARGSARLRVEIARAGDELHQVQASKLFRATALYRRARARIKPLLHRAALRLG